MHAFLLLLLIGCPPAKESAAPEPEETGQPDGDGDGYRADADCDDGAAGVHPGAAEGCDGIDNDCDGAVDGADGDAAAEVCDGIDNDCDGLTDDADSGVGGQGVWYLDGDGDGYGAEEIAACALPAGAVAVAGDCDDGDAGVNPAAAEVCGADGQATDEDCDGLTDDADDSVSGQTAWYGDGDGDGYPGGDGLPACVAPPGTADDAPDCDDTDAATRPGAAPLDSAAACMTDADGDGRGAVSPAAGVSAGSDCDDGDPADWQCTRFGYDADLGGDSGHAPGFLLGAPLSLPVPLTVTAFGLISRSAGPSVQLALYTDAGGAPDLLVLESAPAPLPVGVLEVPSLDAPLLPAGDYWIVAVYDQYASVGISYSYPDTVAYRAHNFSDPLPDSFGPATTYTGQRFNYYVTGY